MNPAQAATEGRHHRTHRLRCVARELASGTWFLLSLSMVLVFLLFLLRNGWRDRMACQAALALAIYFAGTSIRSGLNWGQYIAANRGIDAPIFDDVYLVVALAVGLSVIGAGLCIYSFALGKYRNTITLAASLAALLVPAFTYWLF
jgi:hypothetical protein